MNLYTRLYAWWQQITAPHPALTDPERQQQSRLLNAILLVGFWMVTLVDVVMTTTKLAAGRPASAFFEFYFVTPFVIAIPLLYLVNRRGHYLTAARLLVLTGLVIVVAYASTDFNVLIYLVVLSLLPAIFLPWRETQGFIGLALLATAAIFLFEDQRTGITSLNVPLNYALVAFPVLILYISYRRRMEMDRRRVLEQANRELRDSERLLESRVRERTAELESARQEIEQLYHEQVAVAARLREIDELKSQFLASMSHELRTPMNSILTFTELMAMGTFGEINEEQKSYLLKSLHSGRHLLSLINDVLDITKIQSGMMKLFIEPGFDLAREITLVADTARSLLQDKPVAVVVQLEPDLPLLDCDKRRIRQVLLNLVSNATKFTDTGTITLSAWQEGDELRVTVQDTGPGIPPDQQEIIFQPFIQTETGIKHAGGTGLGLPISRSLIAAHGGEIRVESTPGHGSTFAFSLPLQPVNTSLRPLIQELKH